MAAVEQQAGEAPRLDEETGRYESIKIVPFAKGPMIQVRCVRMEREGENAWIERTFRTYRKALHELAYGDRQTVGIVIR